MGTEPTITSLLSFPTPSSSISALRIGLPMTGRSGYRFPLVFRTIAILKLCEKFSSPLPGAILMFSPTPVPKLSSLNLERVRSTLSFGPGQFGKYRPPPGCRAICTSLFSKHFEKRVSRCRSRSATCTSDRLRNRCRQLWWRGRAPRPLSSRPRRMVAWELTNDA